MPIPVSDQATVTIPLADLRRLDHEFDKKQTEKKTSAPVMPETKAIAQLRERLEAALTVVGFAIGNFNPESTYGWPYEAVEQLGKALQKDSDQPVRTFGITVEQFSRECLEIEGLRAERRVAAQEILAKGLHPDESAEAPDAPVVE